jgi:hypothetical protein
MFYGLSTRRPPVPTIVVYKNKSDKVTFNSGASIHCLTISAIIFLYSLSDVNIIES